MFYSQFILAKKGPLGTIWIAAHLERKLRKNQVTETNISVSVDSILFPEVPIALRLSGHLLLGVVRIYSRKVNYLFHDCSEALSMIKQAFNSGAVDLPPDAATAPFHSITIPENFDLDELEPLPERESNALFSSNSMDQHVTAREQITLQEPLRDDAYLASFELDERFPEADVDRMDMDFDEEPPPEKTYNHGLSPVAQLEEDELPPMAEDEVLDFDRLEPDDPATPAALLDRVDEDNMFQQTLNVDSVEPMLDEERLEPSTLVHDDDMDFEQHDNHSSPGHAQDGAGPGNDDTGEVPASLDQVPDTSNAALQSAAADTNTANFNHRIDDGLEANDTDTDKAQVQEADLDMAQEPGLRQTVDLVLEDVVEVVNEVTEAPALEEPVEGKVVESVELLPHEEQLGKSLPQDDGGGVDNDVQGQDMSDLKETSEPIDMNAAAGGPDDGNVQPIEDVPEYEVVRSAVDAIEQEPDMLEMDKEPLVQNLETPARTAENEDQIMEDVLPPLVDNDGVMDDADGVRDKNSPVYEHDVPDNNDVLAEILGGRSTPAFGVVPTPLAVVPPRAVKQRVSKKRKAVFDLFDLRTVIHADAMRDQLANTADIRRVRKKAPCTPREFWLLQKEMQSNNYFREPSVPGLCSELRDVFHRVCVYSEANLPKPGPQVLLLQNGNAREVEIGTEDVEEEQHSVDPGVGMEDGSGIALPVPSPDQNDTDLNDNGEGEVHEELQLEQPHVHPEISGLEGEVQNVPSPGQPHGNGDISCAEINAATEEVDDDEAARQAAREAILLEWETFDNATLEHESLKEVEAQLAPPFDTEVPPTQLEEEVHVQRLEEMDVGNRLCKEAEDVALLAEPLESDVGPNVPETALVEAPTNDFHLESSVVELTVPSEEAQQGNDVVKATVPSDSPRSMDNNAAGLTVPDEGLTMDNTEAELTVPVDGPNLDPSPEPFLNVENGEVPVDDGNVPVDDGDGDEAPPDTPGEECEVEDLGFLGDARETVFFAEEEDDQQDGHQYMDTTDYGDHETLPQDNTGWSVRTRAVGRYLRATLEGLEMNIKRAEGTPGGPAKLGLERTLAGKSRKEAARMFFETLVLKTKDYIHVEQEEAYADIKLSARPRLIKATF